MRLVRLAGVPAAEAQQTLRRIELGDVWVDLRPRGYLIDLALHAPPAESGGSRRSVERALEAVRVAFGKHVFEVGGRGLTAVVVELLRRAKATVSVAESCTGGWVQAALTAVPGASDVAWGGVVAYQDSAKRELLRVRDQTLREHGAVSAETALAMARGIRRRSGTTFAIAVTGIAGPGGGTPEKPVGTVWVGLTGSREVVRGFRFPGGRREVRRRSVQAALDTLRLSCTPGAG